MSLQQFDHTQKPKKKVIRKKRNFTYTRTIKVLSFGCGVDSVAGLLLMVFMYGWDYFDEIIFADTGSEKDETYAYLDYLTKTLGWPITIVRSRYGKIYEYYYNKRIYPTAFARDCTGKFKIDPFNKFLRQSYGKKVKFNVHLFIDYSEFERVRTSKYNYVELTHPLVDMKLTRDDCINIIKSFGMPVPVKSGCFFCPYTPPKIWAKMKTSKDPKQREYYERALKMQKNSQMREKKKFPLISMKGAESGSLEASCGCFNFNATTDDVDLDKEWKKGFAM